MAREWFDLQNPPVASATHREQRGSGTQTDYEDENDDEEDESAAGRFSAAAFCDGLPDAFTAITTNEFEGARVDGA